MSTIQVHGLWLSSNITNMELLTMNSFVKHGCQFNLWLYQPVKEKLPRGVVVREAEEIFPKEKMFKYPDTMLMPVGGSLYVGVSELFRYKVLYEYGGWWSDMDVTCLKSLEDFQEEYVFRTHGILPVVGNIMKVPPKSELMRRCVNESETFVNSRTTNWHKAIWILCYHIQNLGLDKYIREDICNIDDFSKIAGLFYVKQEIPENWYFIHWINSLSSGISRSSFNQCTFLDLMDHYGVTRKVPKII